MSTAMIQAAEHNRVAIPSKGDAPFADSDHRLSQISGSQKFR
jgi:hypothetical protein